MYYKTKNTYVSIYINILQHSQNDVPADCVDLQKHQPRLLDLPRELRGMIYNYALASPITHWEARHLYYCKHRDRTSALERPPFAMDFVTGIAILGFKPPFALSPTSMLLLRASPYSPEPPPHKSPNPRRRHGGFLCTKCILFK